MSDPTRTELETELDSLRADIAALPHNSSELKDLKELEAQLVDLIDGIGESNSLEEPKASSPAIEAPDKLQLPKRVKDEFRARDKANFTQRKPPSAAQTLSVEEVTCEAAESQPNVPPVKKFSESEHRLESNKKAWDSFRKGRGRPNTFNMSPRMDSSKITKATPAVLRRGRRHFRD